MAGTDIAERTDVVVAQIQNPVFLEQLKESLPEGVSLERFKRVAITAIRTKPELAEANPNSLFASIVKCAQDGLIPDGREAALVKYKDDVSYLPMIGGIRKIAGEYGWTIRTAVVYEHDEFSHYVDDGDEKIDHRPVRPGVERGQRIAAYAIAKHRDGRRKLMVVLHPADIAKRQGMAKTQNVWKEHPDAMWEKSAGHDVFGQISLAENDRRLDAFMQVLDVDPDEATAALYGGTDPRPNLTAGEPNPGEASAPDDVEGVGRQQAGALTGNKDSSGDAPVPGTHDDEPSLDDEGDEQAELIKAAADQAAMFMPPNGQHKNLTLSEILATGEKGEKWLQWALRKGADLTPDAYRQAVWNFSRVYAPELYTQVLGELEASA